MISITWILTTGLCSLFMTSIGIYAWLRKKPMWFWSGSKVQDDEISNIPAYNRANGIMWIAYSLPYWVSTIVGIKDIEMASNIVLVWALISIPLLVLWYKRIYNKYKA
mgnify:CR=1 FL=1